MRQFSVPIHAQEEPKSVIGLGAFDHGAVRQLVLQLKEDEAQENFRVIGGTPVVFVVQVGHQIMNEREIHGRMDLAQGMVGWDVGSADHIIIQRRRPGQVLVLQRDHLEPRFPEVAITPSPFFSGYIMAMTTNSSISVKPWRIVRNPFLGGARSPYM